MLVWLALLVVGWILAIAIYRYASREEQHQRDMLRQESLAQMGEMGAMLAHEIRNPLAGIKGFAQWIEKRPVSENNREHAGRIVSETLRLEKLVEDLLAYARFDEAHIEPFEIADLVTKVLYLIKTEAEGHGVSVVGDCPSGLIVSGNRDRLSQLLLNLCLNGIQAMPDGGSLKISARKTRTGVIIQVSDSGHGINLEDTQHIFEPFFTTKAKGTGLGLAICKKIVTEHNGSISVESNPGTGTTFSITLPATQ
jgi:two-component system sensor histidine kinase HydH